jgi:hypothetical protein
MLRKATSGCSWEIFLSIKKFRKINKDVTEKRLTKETMEQQQPSDHSGGFSFAARQHRCSLPYQA